MNFLAPLSIISSESSDLKTAEGSYYYFNWASAAFYS